MNLLDIYNNLLDIALTMLFYMRLYDKEITPLRQGFSIFLLMPLLLYGYEQATFSIAFRFFYRVVIYFLYLHIGKKLSICQALYYAFLGAACFTVALNILLTRQIRDGILAAFLGALPPRSNAFLISLAGFLERGVILLFFFFSIPFNTERRLIWINWISIFSVVICELYVKYMIYLSDRNSNALWGETNVYAALLQIYLIAFVIAEDRYVISSQKRQAMISQHILDQERLLSLQRKINVETDIRHLHHDMKNHLLAIRSLADSNAGLILSSSGSDNDTTSVRINTYVDELLGKLALYEVQVDTGNDLLNGLISMKISDAISKKITFQIVADFRKLSFISDIDLCTIFGNVLDNAIEACEKIADSEKRYITLKDEIVAGQIILFFINSYEGEIAFENCLPITKKDPHLHGIGLTNLKNVLKKYDGSLHIDLDEPDIFKLVILLPMP